MNISKCLLVLFSFFLVIACVTPTTTFAEVKDSPTFKLQLTENDTKIEISVIGSKLTDLYAYDLTIAFDVKRLLFNESTTKKNGFSVNPIIKDNQLRIAYTKVGKVSGDSGELELAKVSFMRIGEGEAVVSLGDVKLVDSQLNMVTVNADDEVIVKGGKIVLHDISGHWAESSIREAIMLGFIKGYEDGSFKPNRQVTRAEFTVMLVRALKLSTGDGTGLFFTDKDGIPLWARPFVKTAAAEKLMEGYEDQTFRPSQVITREEMAAIASRVLGLKTEAGVKADFVDADQIAAWAMPSVAAVGKAGIMKGRAGNRFDPKANATRAESVSIILAVLRNKA
jgi:hypothetical protein